MSTDDLAVTTRVDGTNALRGSYSASGGLKWLRLAKVFVTAVFALFVSVANPFRKVHSYNTASSTLPDPNEAFIRSTKVPVAFVGSEKVVSWGRKKKATPPVENPNKINVMGKSVEVPSSIKYALTKAQSLKDDLIGSHGHDDGEEHKSHGPVMDTLIILLTTMIIVPLMRKFKTSPILGFLAAGILLGPNGLGLIQDINTSKTLAELGVVFFLFEMGLELSTSKLKSLGSDVFGLGSTQFLVTGALITKISMMAGLPTQTAIVVGAALALSSSAFVLQLLAERGEVGTRYGRASFGILLFQDLAVVPVLVLTPLLAGSGGASAVVKAISIASAKAAVALSMIIFAGKQFLQPLFRFVAKSQSSEAFIATILFTVLGTSALTEVFGLSETLGAFLAGVMLAETSYRHQVEADIKPFRGLLLGLFFITVGFSIDLHLAFSNLGTVVSLVTGLLAIKAAVIALFGVIFGLSLGSAFRTGLLLAQGGEFAFVTFGLAQRVKVLQPELAQLLLLVVALTMALTPALAALGQNISSRLERKRGLIGVRKEDADTAGARDFVMVAGWGRVGQSVCEMLDSKLVRYMAFDMSPTRVIDARKRGLPVYFGDASRPEVLRSAGIDRAKAIVVTLDNPSAALSAVNNIRRDFPHVQVFCRARDSKHQRLLQLAGATAIVPELLEASLLLGGAVLLEYGTPVEEVNSLIEESRKAHLVEAGVEHEPSIASKLGSQFLTVTSEEQVSRGTQGKTQETERDVSREVEVPVIKELVPEPKLEGHKVNSTEDHDPQEDIYESVEVPLVGNGQPVRSESSEKEVEKKSETPLAGTPDFVSKNLEGDSAEMLSLDSKVISDADDDKVSTTPVVNE